MIIYRCDYCKYEFEDAPAIKNIVIKIFYDGVNFNDDDYKEIGQLCVQCMVIFHEHVNNLVNIYNPKAFVEEVNGKL